MERDGDRVAGVGNGRDAIKPTDLTQNNKVRQHVADELQYLPVKRPRLGVVGGTEVEEDRRQRRIRLCLVQLELEATKLDGTDIKEQIGQLSELAFVG